MVAVPRFLDNETGEQKRHVTVLAIPPATTPQADVKAAIIQEYRDREEES